MAKLYAVSSPEGVQLDALRALVRLTPQQIGFSLERRGSGFALFFQGMGKGTFVRGFLMAEKSQQIRIFARAETAFRLLESMGVKFVTVNFGEHSKGEYL